MVLPAVAAEAWSIRAVLSRGLAAALIVAVAGCAAVNQFAQETPDQLAQEAEPMLTAAGFKQLPAQTSAQIDRLKALPALRVNYYVDSKGQTRYWFADPDDCKCLFWGDEAAFQQYENLKLQRQMTTQEQGLAAYQAQQQRMMQQQMMMGPFGFPMGGGFGFPMGGGFGFGGSGIGIVF